MRALHRDGHGRTDGVAAIELLRRIAVVANQATSLASAIQAALDEVCAHTGWPVGHAYLPAPSNPRELVPTDIWHLDDPDRFATFRDITEHMPLEYGSGLPGRILAGGKPAWITDVMADSNFPRARVAADIGVKGAFGFPLLANDKVVGVLEFFSDVSESPDAELLDLMGYVGTQLGRVAEREAAGAALLAQVEHTRLLIDSAYDAYVSIDGEGMITGWNTAAESMFGWSRQDAIGQLLADVIIPHAYRDAHMRGIRRFLDTGQGPILNQRLELTALRRDGSEFPVELAVWPVPENGSHTFSAFIRDVSERKQAETLLRESEHRLVTAQQIAGIGSWEWDIDGDVITWSEQLYRNFGLDESTFVPSLEGYLSLVHPEDRAFVRSVVATALETHQPFRFEHRGVERDGRTRVYSCTGEVVLAYDRPVRMAGTNEDITDRKRAEDALKEAFERERETVIKLRELDQAKTIFTSSVSHELRTPLTSIIGYLDLLQETQREGLNDTQRQMLAVVERNSQRLLGLIEDLLTFSRLQSGTFEPSIGPVSLGELFASVRDAVLPQAVARELDLRFEAVDGLTVAGDGAQLESVLQNLLSNAIKFTPAGGSVVVGASEAHGVVTITVEDTGIGVPPGELSSLFSPFFRSSNAEGLAVPGTGLGLAIVKAIIEGHGGTIEISSEEGRGATVSVSLPAADVTRRKSA